MAITLAQFIREARLRHDMSQAEIARMVGCSSENITAIENGRNKQPSPQIIDKIALSLDLSVEDIYAAIAGRLEHFPWERMRGLNLKDPELELMFRQVDDLLDGEAKKRVKAFIRFTFEEELKKLKEELFTIATAPPAPMSSWLALIARVARFTRRNCAPWGAWRKFKQVGQQTALSGGWPDCPSSSGRRPRLFPW